MMLTCQHYTVVGDAREYCDAPAEVESVYNLAGVGFGPRGTECIVSMAKVLCAAGHRLDIEYDSVEVTP
jgi:hypothetical protein